MSGRWIAALAAVLAAGIAPAAQGRALDRTWTGSWEYRGWPWTFTQQGTSVTGASPTTNYHLSGTVSGATLTGTTYGDNTLIAQCEYVKLTLAADGRSFSGYMSGSVTGKPGTTPTCPPVAASAGIPVSGTCKGGACLASTGETAKLSVLGTWSYRGGTVVVTAAGTTRFAGVVGVAPKERCKRPAGQRIWSIAGSGPAYSGTHLVLAAPGCKPAATAATFVVAKSESAVTLRLCTTAAGTKTCTTLARVKPPA